MFGSILKFTAKAAGTVVLTATGVVSGVIERAAEASGNSAASEIFGDARNASFNKISNIWSDEPVEVKESDTLESKVRSKQSAASHLNKMAEAARKAGRIEEAENYKERYRELLAEIAELKECVDIARNEEQKNNSYNFEEPEEKEFDTLESEKRAKMSEASRLKEMAGIARSIGSTEEAKKYMAREKELREEIAKLVKLIEIERSK